MTGCAFHAAGHAPNSSIPLKRTRTAHLHALCPTSKKRGAEPADALVEAPKKKYRTKAREWGLSFDNALRASLNIGLWFYIVTA